MSETQPGVENRSTCKITCPMSAASGVLCTGDGEWTPPPPSFWISYFVTHFAWHLQLHSHDSASITRITGALKQNAEYLGMEWELLLSCAIDLVCLSVKKHSCVFLVPFNSEDQCLESFWKSHIQCNFNRKSWHTLQIFPHWVKNFILHLSF